MNATPGAGAGTGRHDDNAQLDAAADPELDDFVTVLLTASRALLGVTARSLADVDDMVTVPQFRTLVVLQAHGASRLNTLADRLQVQPSTALRSVDRLITNELVTRHENAQDRREVVIDLTPRGRQLVETVTTARRKAIAGIAQAIPPGQLGHLIEALTAFAIAAGEPLAASDPTGYL
jgi:DNA-binding MarR family transcriptional regulator